MKHTITGFHSIEEMLRSKEKLEGAVLFYSKVGPRVKKIIALAQNLGVEIVFEDDKALDKKVSSLPLLLQNHKGAVLVIEHSKSLLNKTSLEALIASISEKQKSCVLILDSISDCHNMGSIIRSAEQFAIDAVIVPKHASAGGDEQVILKTSAGAASWMKIVEVSNLSSTISLLKDAGFWVFASDMAGQSLYDVKFPDKVAIVMGSEGSGISRLAKKNCDVIVSIPTFGKIDSLNVSVAAGIFLYEVKKQFSLNSIIN
jgi:RNA methyltransferase, trmH family, group 3